MENCYHCGTDCTDEILEFANKAFCCIACKTIFELLNVNDLKQYYELNETPGIKPSAEHEYSFLENEDVVKKFVLFERNDIIEIQLKVPSIHCISCVWLLEHIYKFEEGVLKCTVSFSEKKVRIRYDNTKTSLFRIAQALQSLGYSPDFNTDNKDKAYVSKRNEILKIVVAGICFGNIMLFSFPAYFGLNDINFAYFDFLKFIFVLPVLFYSGSHYFLSFYNFLKVKTMTLDIPIFIGILALFFRSCSDLFIGAHGYWDSLSGLIFFLLLGKYFQDKSIQGLNFDRDYRSFFPFWSRKKNAQGVYETLSADKIKIGDCLLIKNNEIIPCDSQLISNVASLDYSFVSGESESIHVEKNGEIFAGAKLKGSPIEVSVIKEVKRSYLTSLWADMGENKAKNINLVNQMAKFFTPSVLLIATLSSLFSATPYLTFTAITIIACPCALALSYPLTLGFATRTLAELGLYLKNVHVIEYMAKLNFVVFDKTGTLTHSANKEWFYEGEELTENDESYVKSLTFQSNHPLSDSLNAWGEEGMIELDHCEEKMGLGVLAIAQGNKIAIGSQKWLGCSMSTATENNAVAYSVNGKVKGVFKSIEKQREGVLEMIKSLPFKSILLSGDKKGERKYISECFDSENIFYEQSPTDKLKKIESLVSDSNVAMVGDGLNDAGALHKSDVGIAVVEEKNSFFPASDALLQADSLKDLSRFLRFSKGVLMIVYLSFIFSFVYNIIGITLAIMGILTPLIAAVLMPLSSLSILLTAYMGVRVIKCKNFSQLE